MWEQWIPRRVAVALESVHPSTSGIWLVGGAVRDRLMDRKTADLDFAVDGDARQLARALADRLVGHYFSLDDERDAGRVLPPADAGVRTIDFAAMRSDTIEGDLRLRDFTINALGIAAGDEPALIDPLGGLRDIKDRRLRLCYPEAIVDDPVRALRGVRLSTQLDLKMGADEARQTRSAAALLATASAERVRHEFFAMLAQARPAVPLRLLWSVGLLPPVLPLSWDTGVEHGMSVVSRMGDLLEVVAGEFDPEAGGGLAMGEASLRLGRFRHRMAELLTAEASGGRRSRELWILAAFLGASASDNRLVGERLSAAADHLRLSREEAGRLVRFGRYLADPLDSSLLPNDDRREQYCFRRALGDADVGAVLFALAVELSRRAGPPEEGRWVGLLDRARAYLAARFEHFEQLEPAPVVSGDELMSALDLAPGPSVGDLLERIREAQGAGEIHSAEAAIELAGGLLRAAGGSNDPS